MKPISLMKKIRMKHISLMIKTFEWNTLPNWLNKQGSFMSLFPGKHISLITRISNETR